MYNHQKPYLKAFVAKCVVYLVYSALDFIHKHNCCQKDHIIGNYVFMRLCDNRIIKYAIVYDSLTNQICVLLG